MALQTHLEQRAAKKIAQALPQLTCNTASHAKKVKIENANRNLTATNWNVNSRALTFQQPSGTANAPCTASHKENTNSLLFPFPFLKLSKTSVSQKTFAKSEHPNFQNERFPRNVCKKCKSTLPNNERFPGVPETFAKSANPTFQNERCPETLARDKNLHFQNERFPRDFRQK